MVDIIDIERTFEADEKKELIIFNPLSYDVEWQYDGKPQQKIISKENLSLKTSLARHLGNLLVDLYLATKGKNYPRQKAEELVFP